MSGGKNGAPSIISADMRITGDLVSEGEIQVDGTVDGDIKCERLTIGENASVTGEVVAEDVTILGTVTGQIRARAVLLAKTSRVSGDVVHDTLAIESGAYIEGYCRRLSAGEGQQKRLGAEAGEGKLNLVVGAHHAPEASEAAAAEAPRKAAPSS
ncbi:MAG: polymer-forming cytoskeletal protein [Proteobacteria bacterium]|nr:polymer-forming cytoskeletal protein [Pseudomonadota bacterium]